MKTIEDFKFWASMWEFNPNHYDFPEDFNQENGRYENKCHCGVIFTGNKHRLECKQCKIKRESV